MITKVRRWFQRSSSDDGDFIPDSRLHVLENNLGFKITQDEAPVFAKALRHKSIVDDDQYESYETYERLEFLGDAILDLIVTEILFEEYPTEDEGFLTKLRAKLVKGETLAQLATKLNLSDALEIGNRAAKQGLEFSKGILSDVYEAVIAAIYLTKGYPFTSQIVQGHINRFLDLSELEMTIDNFKSVLMEFTQSEKYPLPEYKIIDETGPGHNRTFRVSVQVEGKNCGEGEGKSKKQAEQRAAKQALKNYGLL